VLNREIAENPQLRHQLGLYLLAAFKLKYAPLVQTLGLPQGTLDQLGALDLKMRSDLFDLAQAVRLQGVDANSDPNVTALAQKIRDQHAEAVQNLIGPQGVQQMNDYDRLYDARDLAKQVAAGTYFGTDPLTSAQADQLIQILVESDLGATSGGSAEVQNLDWDSALTQAAAVLPAPQVAALRTLRAKRDLDQLSDTALGLTGETP
jgi:hypothetical protein